MSRNDPHPFSRPHAIDALPPKGQHVTLTADPAAMAAIAADLDILAVNAFSAEFLLTPWRRNGVKVEGKVIAKVAQACVVSLEPVDEEVNEPFTVTFLPGAGIPEDDREIEIEFGAEDPPEPLEGSTIDLGALAVEYLAIGLDPYPRKPGISFEGHIEDDGSKDEKPSPFAKLRLLKPDDEA